MGLFGIVNLILYICNMEEIWKTIEDYPNYMVSNMGRVKAINWHREGKEKEMKPYTTYKGYLRLRLTKNGKSKQFQIHRLVAEAFIPNPDNKPQIDHINTDKTDNRVENLRWVTNKENCNNPISKQNYSKGNKGKKSVSILQFTKDGEFVRKWNSMSDAEQELGIRRLSEYCSNKYGRKSAGGYIWRYADDYERIPFKVFDLELYRKRVS